VLGWRTRERFLSGDRSCDGRGDTATGNVSSTSLTDAYGACERRHRARRRGEPSYGRFARGAPGANRSPKKSAAYQRGRWASFATSSVNRRNSSALARDRSLANFEDTCRHRVLSAAVRRRDVAMTRQLLEHGADPNLPEEGAPRGLSLWIAVNDGRREIVRLLLERGADPNADVDSSGSPMSQSERKDAVDDEYRSTPLGVAARFGQRGMVELLLAHGAAPVAARGSWAAPLARAERKAHREVAEVLRKAGASTGPMPAGA
jgi:ankyrin repeat protein